MLYEDIYIRSVLPLAPVQTNMNLVRGFEKV